MAKLLQWDSFESIGEKTFFDVCKLTNTLSSRFSPVEQEGFDQSRPGLDPRLHEEDSARKYTQEQQCMSTDIKRIKITTS